MKTKSDPNVKQSVLMSWPFLPEQFRGNDLHKLVKILTRRRMIHTDTTLRKLRILRTEGKINYRLAAEKSESLYEKIAL
jgi:hypothetical protein